MRKVHIKLKNKDCAILIRQDGSHRVYMPDPEREDPNENIPLGVYITLQCAMLIQSSHEKAQQARDLLTEVIKEID